MDVPASWLAVDVVSGERGQASQLSRATRKKRKRVANAPGLRIEIGLHVEVWTDDWSVWPAQVLGFPSHIHVFVQYFDWELQATTETAIVLRTACSPLSTFGSTDHVVQKGDTGVCVLCISSVGEAGEQTDVPRYVVITRVLPEGGCAARIRPRKASAGEILFSKEECGQIHWCSKDQFAPITHAGKLLFCPRAIAPSTRQLRPAYTARQLLDLRGDPASVVSQLSAGTTPTDLVNLRLAGHDDEEYAARWGPDLRVGSLSDTTCLGGFSSFAEEKYGGTGTSRTYSRWSCSMCAIMLDRLNPPTGSRGLDAAGGGGNRALQCLWRGYDFTSVDVRPCCRDSLLHRYDALADILPGSGDFLVGDGRKVATLPGVVRHIGTYGFCIGSWPFWRQELYDTKHECADALEHCPSYEAFLCSSKEMFLGCASLLNPGGGMALHFPQYVRDSAGSMHPWPADVQAYARCIGMEVLKDQFFMNKLGQKPRLMIPNYADGGDLTNELEVVCYFVRGAGTSLARPLVTREPTIRRQRRNVVTPERQSAREAEWAALPLSPVARVSFRRSVKEPWGALQAPDRGRMPLDEYRVTWRFATLGELGV